LTAEGAGILGGLRSRDGPLSFYAKAGQVIDLPEHRADRPRREFLEWHLDEVFLKAAAT
jgi:hypothetical protein